ncbi:MAG: tRNA uridine-5-carboxymethylaminomethyl(34) synthesis GTPase MnmE, partial [Oleiagrimonas sp.]|nr:tRNA uridine-5-carboxymethylaminomethyl(34) synthesis GTPase MnmE [Oleiagrimonas sp.]
MIVPVDRMPQTSETIAAIATARGVGGIGVVRVSGPNVPTLAEHLLGHKPAPRHASLCRFLEADGTQIDHGLLLYFPAPASYTGEHVLELQGHGSHVLMDLLLKRVCTLGARLARPGEFTERAFLNGKLDLAQAEAVADLVASRSLAAARAAMRSLEGVFSEQVHALQQQLVALRVHIEAAIDFPEEEIDFLADPAISEHMRNVQESLDTLLKAARRGVRLNDGLSVAIIGRPNVGKSSLMNALAGSERAIVTEIAGTTRDVVREHLDLDGTAIELLDTAGLRDSDDPVEREGVRRAREHMAHADLALLVTDATHAMDDRILFAGLAQGSVRVVVVNKIDVSGQEPRVELVGEEHWLWLSARTGEGMTLLRKLLQRHAGSDMEGAFSARRRHVLALERTAT